MRQRTVHIAAIALGAALLALIGCGGSGGRASTARSASRPPARAGRPNIVFVLTDDLAWNLVRYMPHVLRLQREGESFTNYYVTDSLCCPSRASIFTGRFPHDTHVFDNSAPEGGYSVFHERGEERQTFAVALQRVGYRTAMMGKYLNGYEPGGSERDRPRPGVPLGWNEWDVAGDGYPEYGYRMNSDGHVRKYGDTARDYLTDVLARKSLRFIDRTAAARRPFLLEIATFAPHAPFTPAPRDANAFAGLRAPRSPAFNTVGLHEPAWLSSFVPLDAAQTSVIDAKFRKRAQAVQAVDRMIGEIEQELSARGLARDTYIVFSSDNGLHMGEHRLEPGKLTAFDTDIRVPLIVAGPGVPAGRTVAQMAENIDLCPSFEQLAGARIPASVDGHSLVALLRGRAPANWRREILVEHHGRVLDAGDPDLPTAGAGNPPSYEAIRTSGSLYVEYVTGEREYYDLRRDPFELDNIVASLSRTKLRRLHRALVGVERCHGARACWRAEHARS
ncbi:MAG TPA: sulfatase [Solirubrobacteraceae bacterium]|jgi:arylsulfatase A-like enzyme|nr:sulfatase [Solirubrobacteraceae bacterium]